MAQAIPRGQSAERIDAQPASRGRLPRPPPTVALQVRSGAQSSPDRLSLSLRFGGGNGRLPGGARDPLPPPALVPRSPAAAGRKGSSRRSRPGRTHRQLRTLGRDHPRCRSCKGRPADRCGPLCRASFRAQGGRSSHPSRRGPARGARLQEVIRWGGIARRPGGATLTGRTARTRSPAARALRSEGRAFGPREVMPAGVAISPRRRAGASGGGAVGLPGRPDARPLPRAS